MVYKQILQVIHTLPESERIQLIIELRGKTVKQDYISVRREKTNEQAGWLSSL